MRAFSLIAARIPQRLPPTASKLRFTREIPRNFHEIFLTHTPPPFDVLMKTVNRLVAREKNSRSRCDRYFADKQGSSEEFSRCLKARSIRETTLVACYVCLLFFEIQFAFIRESGRDNRNRWTVAVPISIGHSIYWVISSRQSDRLCTIDRDWASLYGMFDSRIFRLSMYDGHVPRAGERLLRR